MNTSEALRWVMQHMPVEADAALRTFTQVNPQMRGCGWDDALDRLMDSDAHLGLTEPLIERLDQCDPTLVAAVAVTIFYSDRGFATEYSEEMQATAVAATIGNNR